MSAASAPLSGQPLGIDEIRHKIDHVSDALRDRGVTQNDMLGKYFGRADNERMSFALWVHSAANTLDRDLYNDFSKAIGDIIHTFKNQQIVRIQQRGQTRNVEPQQGTSEPSNLTQDSHLSQPIDKDPCNESFAEIKTVKNAKNARETAKQKRSADKDRRDLDAEVGK